MKVDVRLQVGAHGRVEHWDLWMWCPGCDDLHLIHAAHPDGSTSAALWTWNGDQECPDVDPSILVHGVRSSDGTFDPAGRCHSYVRAGQWVFLGDSTHALAGQTVPMVDVPAGWLG